MNLGGSKPKVQEFVPGDEMKTTKAKKKVQFQRDVEKPSFQVKIVMKKDEAIRLLSKCKEGGVLEWKDVANQLGETTLHVDVIESIKKDR